MTPYETLRGHAPDFEVTYRLYATDEGGRLRPPFQHYRCDWAYDGDDTATTGIFMIHPQFLTDDGVVVAPDIPVAMQGRASMWIVIPAMRPYHRGRLKFGVKGYFMEGSRRVGEVVVTRIVALRSNPHGRSE